ncbi:Down syndrome cell adhesion molecule-like protein Dscam2 [Folsomia candida]|uniref:Down syndrome cell adhesion molecule-like protein Dscam2 n=1 Tax=Folsomia candida TaxID=158441 RepID=A0A226EGL3_FOLCA|nr:Down syndrome cell adhesion molecule-like protein Dscam2 [Folsomia candida]
MNTPKDFNWVKAPVLKAELKIESWMEESKFSGDDEVVVVKVLPTGNIRFLPFPIDKFRPDVHFATLQCKLSNPSGTIISPEVVVRAEIVFVISGIVAVLDTPFHIQNPDVAVIRGNNAVLRCLVPPELVDYITVTSWVQDGSLNIYPNFQTGKWLLLPSGELHVFSVDESDGRKVLACRTLHKLTNEVMTSEGARIVVKASSIKHIRRSPPFTFLSFLLDKHQLDWIPSPPNKETQNLKDFQQTTRISRFYFAGGLRFGFLPVLFQFSFSSPNSQALREKEKPRAMWNKWSGCFSLKKVEKVGREKRNS